MGRFIEAARAGELADGEKKKVVIEGRELLLARVAGRYYATDDRCPHLKGDLSAGSLEGTVIACPLQGSQFDIRDGRVISWRDAPAEAAEKARPLKTYNVGIAGDRILVEID
jgi:nitrite reductase/ring-hydroxylating ferredoxin subunit